MTALAVTALHPDLGVEVHGVDLRTVTGSHGCRELRALFEEHSLLLFRDQELDDDAHLAFGSAWGPIEDRSASPAGTPTVDRVSNRLGDDSLAAADDLHTIDLMGNQLWHTDSIFLPVPALANILAARVLSSTGGETEFASTRVGWRTLPADLRRRVDGMVLSHRLAHSRAGLSPELERRHRDRFPDQSWRATWTNPVNGHPALYLASHTFAVEGMPDEEGRALIAALIDHCTRPERVYAHRWRPGDVLVWDERALLHRGRPWPYEEERTLASICISATSADGLDDVRVRTAS
jgi:alpha-ketoglutarate-dependent 2,4-dichlorophenoxyacetate dioxygenase